MGSGWARAGKFEKLFLSHEFYCGKLPTIFSTSAPSYQATISKQHKQGWPWAGPGLAAKFWKSTGSGRVRAGKFEKLYFCLMSFIVENYQQFSVHQHHCQENITKHIKVNCLCCFEIGAW